MAGETVITVVGNLTHDPELRYTGTGAAVANFTVASTARIFDRQTGDWNDGDALFLRCTIWRQPAEHVAECLIRWTRDQNVPPDQQVCCVDMSTSDGVMCTTEVCGGEQAQPPIVRYAVTSNYATWH